MASIGEVQVRQGPQGPEYAEMTAGGWEPIDQGKADLLTSSASNRFMLGVAGAETEGLAGNLGNAAGIASGLGGIGRLGGSLMARKLGMEGMETMAGRVRRNADDMIPQARRLEGPPGSIVEPPPAAKMAEAEVVADAVNNGDLSAAANRRWNVPVVREIMEEVDNFKRELVEPADLNDLQVAMMPEMERLGMQFLPGQKQGSKFMLTAVNRHPSLMAEFAPERAITLQRFGDAVKKGIGVGEDTPQTGQMFGQSERILGQQFNQIRDSVRGSHAIDAADRELIEPLLTPTQRREWNLDSLNGRDLMALRSELNEVAGELYGQNLSNQAGRVDEVRERVEDLINKGLGAADKKAWKIARERWKLKIMMQRGKGFGSGGEFNPATLDTSARRMWREYATNDVLTTATGMEQSTVDVLNWIKGIQAFADNVPNSGTPTGNMVNAFMSSGGWKEYLKGRGMARAVRQTYEKGE